MSQHASTRMVEVHRGRESLLEALDALSARLDTVEQRLDRFAGDSAAMQETLATLVRHRVAEPVEDPGEASVDLNEAGFEDLRRVGLSATQAARVLTHRDAVGGFDSFESLREVPGLPDGLVERLRSRTRV